MVRYQYCFCLIERGFSPLDFAVFYPAHAVGNPSFLDLQDEVAVRLTIYKVDLPSWRSAVLSCRVRLLILRLDLYRLRAAKAPTKIIKAAAAQIQSH